jgi:hypothetical protein
MLRRQASCGLVDDSQFFCYIELLPSHAPVFHGHSHIFGLAAVPFLIRVRQLIARMEHFEFDSGQMDVDS